MSGDDVLDFLGPDLLPELLGLHGRVDVLVELLVSGTFRRLWPWLLLGSSL